MRTLNIEQIAEAAHEANRVYCRSIGDWQQDAWETWPQHLKNSVIDGVKAIIADPSMTPEESHKRWMGYKISEGWTYGKMKDDDAKTHPNLVPYSELPEEQRVKDYLFQSIVRVLARLPKGYVTT